VAIFPQYPGEASIVAIFPQYPNNMKTNKQQGLAMIVMLLITTNIDINTYLAKYLTNFPQSPNNTLLYTTNIEKYDASTNAHKCLAYKCLCFIDNGLIAQKCFIDNGLIAQKGYVMVGEEIRMFVRICRDCTEEKEICASVIYHSQHTFKIVLYNIKCNAIKVYDCTRLNMHET
jgi:hypothetical protein